MADLLPPQLFPHPLLCYRILVFSSSFKIPPPVVLYHASRIRNKKMAITRVELERMASKKKRTFMLVVVVGGGDVDVDVLFFIPYIYY